MKEMKQEQGNEIDKARKCTGCKRADRVLIPKELFGINPTYFDAF